MSRPTRALFLVALLLVAALAAPAHGAKKAAKKGSAATPPTTSAVGVLDTDEDDDAGGLVGGYGNLGWITVDQYEVWSGGGCVWRGGGAGGARVHGAGSASAILPRFFSFRRPRP